MFVPGGTDLGQMANITMLHVPELLRNPEVLCDQFGFSPKPYWVIAIKVLFTQAVIGLAFSTKSMLNGGWSREHPTRLELYYILFQVLSAIVSFISIISVYRAGEATGWENYERYAFLASQSWGTTSLAQLASIAYVGRAFQDFEDGRPTDASLHPKRFPLPFQEGMTLTASLVHSRCHFGEITSSLEVSSSAKKLLETPLLEMGSSEGVGDTPADEDEGYGCLSRASRWMQQEQSGWTNGALYSYASLVLVGFIIGPLTTFGIPGMFAYFWIFLGVCLFWLAAARLSYH